MKTLNAIFTHNHLLLSLNLIFTSHGNWGGSKDYFSLFHEGDKELERGVINSCPYSELLKSDGGKSQTHHATRLLLSSVGIEILPLSLDCFTTGRSGS